MIWLSQLNGMVTAKWRDDWNTFQSKRCLECAKRAMGGLHVTWDLSALRSRSHLARFEEVSA